MPHFLPVFSYRRKQTNTKT